MSLFLNETDLNLLNVGFETEVNALGALRSLFNLNSKRSKSGNFFECFVSMFQKMSMFFVV
jgi:hypothetical protein